MIGLHANPSPSDAPDYDDLMALAVDRLAASPTFADDCLWDLGVREEETAFAELRTAYAGAIRIEAEKAVARAVAAAGPTWGRKSGRVVADALDDLCRTFERFDRRAA